MPDNPIPYARQYEMGPPPRPLSISVLAIIGIILAAITLLGGVCGLLSQLSGSAADPFSQAMQQSAILKMWTVAGSVVGMLLAIVLLVGAIGALVLRPWARRAMVFYAAAEILLQAVGLVIFLTVTLPLLRPLMESTDSAARFGGAGIAIAAPLGTILWMIYPIFVLIFMRKPPVKLAFGEVG